MTLQDIIAYFGSKYAAAAALGIRRQSVQEWTSVPPLRQLQLEGLTRGKLKAEPRLHVRRP